MKYHLIKIIKWIKEISDWLYNKVEKVNYIYNWLWWSINYVNKGYKKFKEKENHD
jgi:hypothetical protein